MHIEMNEFRIPGVIYIILYPKNMHDYATYNIPFDLQGTRGWSPTWLSKYTFENSGLDRGVDRRTNVNTDLFTDLFALNFHIHTIYIYDSL